MARLSTTVIFVVLISILCAAVNAKLSMYDDDPGSRGRITAKATKLHECSVDRVNITPLAQIVMRLAADTARPLRIEPRRSRPVMIPFYDKSLFLRPPPCFA